MVIRRRTVSVNLPHTRINKRLKEIEVRLTVIEQQLSGMSVGYESIIKNLNQIASAMKEQNEQIAKLNLKLHDSFANFQKFMNSALTRMESLQKVTPGSQ